MPRIKRDNPFENRTNRFKHLTAGQYHQTTVDEAVYLLYRRGRKKSMWYIRPHGREQRPLALADDYQDADGTIAIPDALRPYMDGLDRIT